MANYLVVPKGARAAIRAKFLIGVEEVFVESKGIYTKGEWMDLDKDGLYPTWDSERNGYILRRK